MRRFSLVWLSLAVGMALSEATLLSLLSLLCFAASTRAEVAFGYTKIIFATQNHLITPVSVNHTGVTWWMVDTGAPRSMIDPELANRLGLQAATTFKAGSHDADRGTRFPIVVLDDLLAGTFHCGRTACVERSIKEVKSFATTAWTGKFDKTGLIGLDLLHKYGALINIRAGKIFFSPTGNLGMSREGYEKMGFTYVPLTVTSSARLELVGTLAGRDYSFFIDTGAPMTVLENWVRTAANIPYVNAGEITLPFTDIKNARLTYGKATDFKLGSYDAKGALVGFAPTNLEATGFGGFSHQLAGTIGIDFLYYRSAIIDIGGRALYLKPSTNPH
jgi:predicted aspartyl protease